MLLLALRYTRQTQCWPEPGPGLLCTHTDPVIVTDPMLYVMIHSHPGPKACWTLHVHTQETVNHTLLSVTLCYMTDVIRLSVAVRRSNRKRESNYKQGRISLICWPNA